MLSTKKNLLGLKSFAGLALRNGCSSFGFRRIGVINPLFQTIFVFKNEFKAMAFYSLLTKVFMVNGASRKFSYAGKTRFYLVVVDLPDLFRFSNPLTNKLHLKSFKKYCQALGTSVQIGNPYNHPHAKLKNAIPTNYTTVN
jgi:hypothetical protein